MRLVANGTDHLLTHLLVDAIARTEAWKGQAQIVPLPGLLTLHQEGSNTNQTAGVDQIGVGDRSRGTVLPYLEPNELRGLVCGPGKHDLSAIAEEADQPLHSLWTVEPLDRCLPPDAVQAMAVRLSTSTKARSRRR